ncbi:MAG TPA: PQQ-binding-like beta-propeller repeat protein [Vicinamibacterales bacterium]|nr:PQQ-binding-like beta-propeller repeat protein [Vicinamibacterales bacterium]
MRILFSIALAVCSCEVATAQWPEFRGPLAQGHSEEKGLPLEWSEIKNVMWKVPIAGLGWSTPVIADGRVWLTTAIEDRGISLRAIAFDIATGKEVVNVEVFKIPANRRDINPKNSWASPSPVIDGDRIYVHFGADGTAALSSTGEIIWKNRFEYQSQHGAGGSPIVYGDLLIFSCDGSDVAFVIALDKRTGKTKWKTNRGVPADQAYTTPLVIRVGAQDQLISVGAFRVRAYEPLTGKEIWRVRYDDGFSNVPRPVFGHGLVFITTGFQQPSLLAIRPDGRGDVTRTHVAWSLTRGAPLTPSPIVVGDDLYIVNDGGIASCIDARTGNVIWQSRLGGTYSASPVFADGRLYFPSEQGVTTVLAPGKEARRLAANRLDGGLLASMAVAGGSFFLRTDSALYRIGERTPAAP